MVSRGVIIMLYSIVFYFIQLCFILFYCIVFYSIVLYFIELPEPQSNESHDSHLCCERLRGCHSVLSACIQIDTCMCVCVCVCV